MGTRSNSSQRERERERGSGRQVEREGEIRRLQAIRCASTFLAVTKADKVDQAR